MSADGIDSGSAPATPAESYIPGAISANRE